MATVPTLHAEPMPRRPQEALAELLAGNRRFVAGRSRYGHHISAAAAASGGQNPYAVVLGCIDSRVPVEAVFDQTFGMICVIRSGGHVLDRAVLGSVAFAVDALDVPLIVVLGHDRCGAVSATVEALRGGTRPVGELGYLVDEIGAAADGTDLTDPAAVHLVTSAHTIRTVERLRAGQPDVTVVGARYDLDTGQVRLLS